MLTPQSARGVAEQVQGPRRGGRRERRREGRPRPAGAPARESCWPGRHAPESPGGAVRVARSRVGTQTAR